MNPTSYGKPAVALHWLLAVLLTANFAFGLYTVGLPLSPAKLRNFSWHKWAGVTIFLLSFLRLAWRLRVGAPHLPLSVPPGQVALAKASHALLYGLFFAVPLTGWLFSSAAGFQTVYFGVLPIPDLVSKDKALADLLRLAHRTLNYLMAALVLGHVAAALKHHLVDRDDVLARMLPFLDRKRP